MKAPICLALLSAAMLSLFAIARAQAPFLDTSFNHTGIRTEAISPTQAWGTAVTLDSQSNILVAGYAYIGNWRFGLMRFRPDGSLDTTLQHTGLLTTPTDKEGDMAQAIAIGPGNKITLAGFYFNTVTSEDHYAIIRYASDGSPDTSFGINGAVYDSTILGRANALLVQPDNKTIVVGNGRYRRKDTSGFMLLRLKDNGQPDSSFGTAGIVRTTIPGSTSYAVAAKLLPDGKILVGGSSGSFDNRTSFTLVRYKTDGSRDSTFGTNGVSITPIGIGNTLGATLLYQIDGSVILVGNTSGSTLANTVAMICVQPDGSLKTSFGNGGKVMDTVAGPPIYVGSAVQLSDGEIIVGGIADSNGISNYALARYYRSGQHDRLFNSKGYLMTQVGQSYSYIMALAVQPDDKIVAAGWAWGTRASNEFAVARYTSFTPLEVKPIGSDLPALRVYPNPVSSSLTIDGAAGGKAILVNSLGQQVLQCSIDGSRHQMDMSMLPAGVYFLRISDANGGSSVVSVLKQ